jgi:hypothetical protein
VLSSFGAQKCLLLIQPNFLLLLTFLVSYLNVTCQNPDYKIFIRA